MKPTVFALAALLPFLFCGSARAQTSTGIKLQGQCKHVVQADDKQTLYDTWKWDIAFCAGFIEGTIQTHNLWQTVGHKTGHELRDFCISPEPTNDQIIQIFVKYLDDHPEELHKQAVLLFTEAMIKAFPCKAAK